MRSPNFQILQQKGLSVFLVVVLVVVIAIKEGLFRFVYKVGDDYVIDLNEDGLPKLRINNYYREILNNKASLGEATKQYIQEKLGSLTEMLHLSPAAADNITCNRGYCSFSTGFF